MQSSKVLYVVSVLFVLGFSMLCTKESRAQLASPKQPTTKIDTLRDSAGNTLYTFKLKDIIVRVRNGSWMPKDSTLFFSERKKVEWASTILDSQVKQLKDSLQTLMDSAGTLIGKGKFTQASLEKTVDKVNEALERTVKNHTYSLHRLEDYQNVLNAVTPYLRDSSPR